MAKRKWSAKDLRSKAKPPKPMKDVSSVDPPPPQEPPNEPPPPDDWEPFPIDCLPTPAANFVRDGAEILCVDPSYVALPVLTVMGALIGTTRRIRLRHKFEQPACIWTAYFGDSGNNKSASYELTMEFLKRRQFEWHDQYNQDVAAWEESQDVVDQIQPGQGSLPEPTLKQIWTTDATVEGLGELMANNRAALVASPELSGFIESMSRYKAVSDRAKWLEFYDGGCSFINRKKHKGVTAIRSACVCVTGGIQPYIFFKTMTDEHLAAGLGARFLFAWPPPRQQIWHNNRIPQTVEKEWEHLCDSLLTLQHGTDDNGNAVPVICSLSQEATDLYGSWFTEWHAKKDKVKNPHLKAAWAKLFGQAGRLALIHHCCLSAIAMQSFDHGPHITVHGESMRAALTMAEWFASQAVLVYGEEGVDVSLVNWIQERGGKVTVRDLYTSKRIEGKDKAQRALQDLVDSGKGEWIKEGKKVFFSLHDL